MRGGWPWVRRWLYLIHRWMGIAGCLLIAMWFVSGLVMMYVAFPGLGEAERLAGLPALDVKHVRVGPDAAMASAGLDRWPRSLRLEMTTGAAGPEPVWRMLDWAGKPHTVSAVSGTSIGHVTAAQAIAIAARFAGHAATWQETSERDQWTVPNGLDAWRPLHRIAIDDGRGGELYVSARTGEVMRDTNRAERFWNWLGSVPHWLYFTPVRTDPPLWRQVVLWTSGPCIVVALSGIWIGWLRLRVRRRFAHGSVGGISPYRGWMGWHHVAGLAGALFLLAWLVSGWLSVNPNQWFNGRGFDNGALQRYAGHGKADFPLADDALRMAAAGAGATLKEIRLQWLGGQPMLVTVIEDGVTRSRNPRDGASVALGSDTLARAAMALMPGSPLAGIDIQREDDAYWYRHHAPRKFPVVRVRFADADATWAYIDPDTGQVIGRGDNNRRAYRWLFNAAHSWDLRWLLRARPAWDVVMWVLSLVGIATSVSGVVVGWRRMFRKRHRH